MIRSRRHRCEADDSSSASQNDAKNIFHSNDIGLNSKNNRAPRAHSRTIVIVPVMTCAILAVAGLPLYYLDAMAKHNSEIDRAAGGGLLLKSSSMNMNTSEERKLLTYDDGDVISGRTPMIALTIGNNNNESRRRHHSPRVMQLPDRTSSSHNDFSASPRRVRGNNNGSNDNHNNKIGAVILPQPHSRSNHTEQQDIGNDDIESSSEGYRYTVNNRTMRIRYPMDLRNCPYCDEEPYEDRHPETWAFYKDCEPVVPELESRFHPTCNSIHEIPLDMGTKYRKNDQDSVMEIEFLSEGGTFRSARTLYSNPVSGKNLYVNDDDISVFKTLYSDGDFTHETMDMHVLDTIVMEHATANPRVVRAYSYCGHAVITEFCDDFKHHVVKEEHLGYMERLHAAIQASSALDTIHHLGSTDRNFPSFAHLDLKPSNLMLSRLQGTGLRVILNDFNLGMVMRRKKEGGEMCQFPMKMRYGGAPELGKDSEGRRMHVDPIAFDIFRFGHVLYATATDRVHQSSNQGRSLGSEIVDEYVFAKQVWNQSAPIVDHDQLAQLALLYATIACTREDPKERISSRELLEALTETLRRSHLLAADPTLGVTAKNIRSLFEVRAPVLSSELTLS